MRTVGVRTYRELLAWQRAMDMVVDIYKATQRFPREEMYALTNQLRRAAVSVPSNIAEGQGRGIGREFAQYLRIAMGSIQEVETQLLLAERLSYICSSETQVLLQLTDEVGRLTRGLWKSVSQPRISR
jgi:four helix bundle protein